MFGQSVTMYCLIQTYNNNATLESGMFQSSSLCLSLCTLKHSSARSRHHRWQPQLHFRELCLTTRCDRGYETLRKKRCIRNKMKQNPNPIATNPDRIAAVLRSGMWYDQEKLEVMNAKGFYSELHKITLRAQQCFYTFVQAMSPRV